MITRILWALRAINYSIKSLILEKPKGLNFSSRDKYINKEIGFNGYAMTSKRALRNMLSKLDVKAKKIVDIGSGKGAVVYNSFLLGAEYSVGIEFSPKLHKIAVKNFQILECSQFCSSINVDAREFLEWKEFDIFFLFNPFDDKVYSEVMITIKDQLKSDLKTRWIIAYGKSNENAILNIDNCKVFERGICPYRNTPFIIFRIN